MVYQGLISTPLKLICLVSPQLHIMVGHWIVKKNRDIHNAPLNTTMFQLNEICENGQVI